MTAKPEPEQDHADRWFVLLNGSRARAYARRIGVPGYALLREWDEPEARMRDAELGEDKPGRAFPFGGATQRSAMEHDGLDDSPKAHAKRGFFQRLAEELAAALRQGEARSLVLVAPPPCAKAVRAHLPKDAAGRVAGEHHADLTQLSTPDLFARLDALRHGM